jgi:hypothetical protein
MLDRPKPTAAMEIMPLRFVDAKSIADQVSQILLARIKAEGRLTPSIDLKNRMGSGLFEKSADIRPL